jgi:hypothetical protein
MAKDIFEKMESIHEVNRMAAELRRLGMKEKLKALADKNWVMEEDFEAYVLGKRYFLVDAGETRKTYDTARAKLMDEMLALNDPLFGNIIGGYLLQRCSGPGFQESVLQEHKTLQRCLEYVMEQAYGLLDESQKKAGRNTAVAVVSDQVFEWAGSYYDLDDKAALEEKRKKAEEAFQNRNKPKTSTPSGKGTGKRKTSKSSKKKSDTAGARTDSCGKEMETGVTVQESEETQMEPSDKSIEETADSAQTENLPGTKPQAAQKGQIEGQVSMFGMGTAA